MDKTKILNTANIPEEIYDKCYIDEEGNIFRPNGEKNGEDIYNEWLENKGKEVEKEPTTQEQINAQLLEEIAQQKIVNVQLMQEIATLKGGNANV